MPQRRIDLDLSDLTGLCHNAGDLILYWLKALRVSEEDRLDVRQDVYLAILERRRFFRGDSAIVTWIYAICQRVASKYHRGRAVRETVVSMDASPLQRPADEQLAAHQLARLVRGLIAQLPRREETLLHMIDLDGRTYSEALPHFEVTVEAMRLIRHRALRRLATAAAPLRRRYL